MHGMGLQIMWAEAMGKLEGMESADRERLWPQLVQGFKDLSDRLKVFKLGFVGLNVHLVSCGWYGFACVNPSLIIYFSFSSG